MSYWSKYQSQLPQLYQTPAQPPATFTFYNYTLEINQTKMSLINEAGNVAIALNKVKPYVYGANSAVSTMKEYEIIADSDFECGGTFVVLGDGSGMGILTREKTLTNPGEVSIGIMVPTVPTVPSVPETTGFSWKGTGASIADDYAQLPRKRTMVLDEAESAFFPPNFF